MGCRKGLYERQFIKRITRIKTDTKAWETAVRGKVTEAEDRYIANPTDDTKRAWLGAQSMSRQLALQLSENKRFFQQQSHFEEGEATGHMLMVMAHAQWSSSLISAICDAQGTPRSQTCISLGPFTLIYTPSRSIPRNWK